MKKLLLILLGIVIISIIVQKFGLLTYFSNNSKLTTQKEPVNNPAAKISPIIINRPIIGIHYRMIDKQTALQNKLVEGAYITQVIIGSPAEKANLQEEDIITELDGNKIGGSDEQILIKLITGKKPGEQAILKIWRNKVIKTIFITLETAQ